MNCDRYLAWASAFLIVYSIDNRLSFEVCQQYVETVTLYTKGLQSEAPIILVGNKVDMERYRFISIHCLTSIGCSHCYAKKKISLAVHT